MLPADRLPGLPGAPSFPSAESVFLAALTRQPCVRVGAIPHAGDTPSRLPRSRGTSRPEPFPRPGVLGRALEMPSPVLPLRRALLGVSRPLPVGRPGDRAPRFGERRVLGSRGRASGFVGPGRGRAVCACSCGRLRQSSSPTRTLVHGCPCAGVRVRVHEHVGVKRATCGISWCPRAALSAEPLFSRAAAPANTFQTFK